MSGQKIIDGLQEVIDGHVGRITTVIVPEAKIFPVPPVKVFVVSWHGGGPDYASYVVAVHSTEELAQEAIDRSSTPDHYFEIEEYDVDDPENCRMK